MVAGVAIQPVAAQQPTPTGEGDPVSTPTGNETAAGNATNGTPAQPAWMGEWNQTGEGRTGNATGQSGGGLFGLSPAIFFGGALDWFIKQAQQGFVQALDVIPQLVNGMAAPGVATNPATWINPQNGLWPGVYEATQLSIALAVIGLTVAGSAAFRHGDAYVRRQKFRRLGLATVMVLLTYFLAPMGLHVGSVIGRSLAPSGAEFAQDPANLAKFGVGLIIAGVLAFAQTAVVAIGLFVLAAQYFLTHLVVFLWPVGWALRAFDGFLKSLGDFVIYLYGGLIALNVAQAMILRFVFELPWYTGSLTGSLMGFLGTTAGLAFALIWLPKSMLVKVTAGSAVGLGVSAGQRATKRGATQTRERLQETVSEYRSSGRGTRSDAGPAGGNSGQNGEGTAAAGRADRSGGGGRSPQPQGQDPMNRRTRPTTDRNRGQVSHAQRDADSTTSND